MSDWEEHDYGDDPYEDEDYEENNSYSDEEWKQDLGDPDLSSEFKDRERVGGISGCWLTGIDGKPLKTQTPLGRFCLKVDAVSRNINSSCFGFNISDREIQKLLDKSQELERVEFKNPTAFVLGYLATDSGNREITPTSLKSVWICYQRLGGIHKDLSIKKPDIIRYARLWIN